MEKFSMANETIFLKNYEAPLFTIEKINLTFDLYDDHALIKNVMKIKRLKPGELVLNGDELELVNLLLDDEIVEKSLFSLEKSDLIIRHCPDQFTLTVVTRIRPQENTQLSGLYRSNQLFCTQCEAEGFRRITFYPDRPDVLSVFTTRISADKQKYPVLLSNGNLMDKGEESGGRHWVCWEDPFKKPSYLFALVAGNLACISDEFITQSQKKVALKLYIEPGNEDKCSHAMTSIKKAMAWDEKVFGREYDLSIFMVVAVSDFNMGAMENKGLNIFNSKYILARPDTATDQDFADVEGVVGHEYFHNWTGNRITCRDWFQLSLKEGLTVFRDQEFSGDMNSREVNRILDVKALLSTQFPEDAGSMAHPVRPSSYQEINNFYTATIYNKGAEVIRMQQTLLGKEGFRKGMDLYFSRHDGQAVTINDFVKAMEEANGVDFTQFFRWYEQAGTPQVYVERTFKEDTLYLTLTQSCPFPAGEKEPFHIPIRIALFASSGKQIPLTKEVLELREVQQTFTFSGLEAMPIISLLRDFSAPIKIMQSFSESELLALMRFETNGYAKWNAAQKLSLKILETLINTEQKDWQISNQLILAYQHILLDDSLDPALKAELLTPPGFEEVIADLVEVDVDKVEAARDFYRASLGQSLLKVLTSTYETLQNQEKNEMNGKAYGMRKLKNICLWFMMKADEKAHFNRCHHQFIQAKTMSDQLTAFALLNNCDDKQEKNKAIDHFYQQWQHDTLVLDKWFAVQACSEASDTLFHVRKLMMHPDFSLKNPNKVRSLMGAFVHSNPRNFHVIDGSGYEFLTECLINLDKINPQIAARLATPFTRWLHYDATRKRLMKQHLLYLASLDLSKDLSEVVNKSLMAEKHAH